MNTKLLMIASALFMLICGIALQFFPSEVLVRVGAGTSETGGVVPLLLQVTGATLIGFALMNWMAKTVLIGGIYARPLAIGNFAHFLIGALAMIKYSASSAFSPALLLVTAMYTLFAVGFGYVFMTHPKTRSGSDGQQGAKRPTGPDGRA